ncbi:MAG: hypothetical protein ABH879_10365 [archaeon]
MKTIVIALVCIFLTGCSGKYSETIDNPEILAEGSGIKISPVTITDAGDRIHNVYNFEPVEQRVRVTTVCYGQNDAVIDTSDTSIMTLPAESVTGWNPKCPLDASRYTLNISLV